MRKKIILLLITLTLIIPCLGYSESKPLIATDNTTTPSQAEQFLSDRNATKEMMDCIPFIYDYCDKIGIDATLIIGISSIETGYGKSNLCKNNNNPGGMKARRGWMKFNSLKDGYKAMIDKIAVMSGVKKSNSYYYNSCKYIEDLGKIYWCENSVDHGYYNMLVKQLNRIKSYKRLEKKVTKKVKENKLKENKKITINPPKKKQSAKDYLMSFTKKDKKSGMELIYGAIKK